MTSTVAICGGGSLGLAYAALMSEKVTPNLFVRSAAQADEINRDGVSVTMGDDVFAEASVPASADPASLNDADIVIALVKYPDTAALGAILAEHLRADATLISLQTGVRPLTEYSSLLGDDRVLGGVSYLGARRTSPCSVDIGANLKTILGLDRGTAPHTDKVRALVGELDGTKLELELSTSIERVIWDKMVIACSQNAVSGLTGATFRQLREDVVWHGVLKELIAEIEAASAASGIELPPNQLDRVFANWESLPNHRASTFVDLQNGRLTEVDALNGTIADLAAEHGFSAPISQALTALVHMAENAAPSA